jgi:Domain of unknown function (DUF4382)
MTTSWKLAASVGVLGALAVSGCDQTPGTIASTQNAQLTVMLADAPPTVDMKSAVVTISKIYLVGSGDSASEVVLSSQPVTTDLLTLSSDVSKIVDGAEVPAGTYHELRFVVDGGYIQVADGSGDVRTYATDGYQGAPQPVDGTLKCPSCAQSGIKVVLPDSGLTLANDQQVTLLVDFDVSQTFGHQAGNSGMWVMHPTLVASDIGLAGSVNVTLRLGDGVTLPSVGGNLVTLADFTAQLKAVGADSTAAGQTMTLAAVSGDSVFGATFSYLVPGDYTVTILGPDSLTITLDPASADVAVPAGGSASADFTLTAASLINGP